MKPLVATIKNPNVSNANNYARKKETVETLSLIASVDGELREVCDARFYMSRSADGASPVYCSIWVFGKNVSVSGSGRASGYGYHKLSAALADALNSAGIELFGDVYGRVEKKERADIGGVGEEAMRGALLAVAIAAGADVTKHIFS